MPLKKSLCTSAGDGAIITYENVLGPLNIYFKSWNERNKFQICEESMWLEWIHLAQAILHKRIQSDICSND